MLMWIDPVLAQWTPNTTLTNVNMSRTGNVAIGTTSPDPDAKLQVNGTLLCNGSLGNTPVSGSGTRMMWNNRWLEVLHEESEQPERSPCNRW